MAFVSLQTKFIAITGPLVLIGVMGLIGWGERQTYVEAHDRLEKKLEHLSANQSIVLSRSLAKGENLQVSLTAAGMLADPDVVFVRVADPNGNTISELGQPDPDGFQRTRSLQFVKDEVLVSAGTLTVGISFAPLKAALLDKIWLTAALALLLAFMLWLGNFLAFRWFVGRPLAGLHKAIESWRTGDIAQPSEIRAKDEMGKLSRAFAEMQKTVTERENDLKAIKDDLEKRVEDRTAELARQASHDGLTGLPNRSYLHKVLEDMLEQSAQTDRPIAVAHIDLDRFKEVNDTLGHAAGDQVLIEASSRMKAELGENTFLARVGGDEFVFATYIDGSKKDVVNSSAKLVRSLSNPMKIGEFECKIGASIGVAISQPGQSTSTQLLIDSDIALYEVKRAGRGAVSLFLPAMGEVYRNNQRLIKDLKSAVETRDFVPFFQPQISLIDGTICGFELLARWPHPTDGLLSPAQFLPLADEAGLTAKIDEIIMEKGFELMSHLRAAGMPVRRLSINASSRSLSSPNFPDKLMAVLKRWGLEPQDLAVEILEETLISDNDQIVLDCLQRLHMLGMSIELDDFGTGYAALSNLATLNLSAIKLDKSLIMPLPDPASEAIVSAMVALCSKLKIGVVAEGVETAEHLNLVRDLGCDVGQGYHVSRPIPADQVPDWVADWTRKEYLSSNEKLLPSCSSGAAIQIE